MNKTQLVDALAARIGDRRTAATAVDGLLETIVDTVRSGNAVTITGFGVFEGRARAARVARNPRTGEPVDVPATTVPAFRAGTGFRTAVGDSTPAARATPPARRTRTASAEAEAVADAPAKVARRSARGKAAAAPAAKGGKSAAKADKPAAKSAAAKATKGKSKK